MIKFAFRTLFKSPFVTAIAILSLALGIGANVAIFSLFDEILLRPLPVADPGRLVNLTAHGPNPGYGYCGQEGDCKTTLSYPMLLDLQRAQTGLAGVAGHFLFDANIAYHNTALKSQVLLVSGSYFPLLQLRPAVGRLIAPDDDRTIGANFVAVLDYGYWQRQLGGDSAAIGSTIQLNGKSFTIIGVAPPDFHGTTLGASPIAYAPLTMASVLGVDTPDFFQMRRYYWVYAFGRLQPGVSVKTAERQLNTVYRRIISEVEAPLQREMSAATMAQFKAKEITLEDGSRGQSVLYEQAKKPLVLLFATTAIVLLIACANIANLLMARGANRSLEMAVRLSLGASRRQLLAQLLTESVLLAAIGGAVSLVIAPWTLGALSRLVSPDIASSLQFKMSGPAFAFAALLSVANGLLFGVFPALYYTRSELMTAVREGVGKHSGARSASRFRNGLATAQIALSMALLAAAGLFVTSLRNVSRVDLGIKTENVVSFGISPGLSGYSTERSRNLVDAVQQQLGAAPGVTGVAVSELELLAGSNRGRGVAVQGFKGGPDVDNSARYDRVGPGFFRVMGIPMVAGRDFSASDELGTQKVAIVNEAFAKEFGLGQNAVGKYMGDHGGDTTDFLIVGVVKDAKYSQVKDQIPPQYFVPERQDRNFGSTYFYVRTSDDPARLLQTIRSAVAREAPTVPLENMKTMSQQVRENVYLDRMVGILSTAFAALATLLAAIGLYGVLAYSVAQRTREIGVRMALGADSGNVQLMVLRQVGMMTIIGGSIGLAGAVAFGRGAQSLLFEIKGYDPLVMAASALALALVALGAGYVPALKASKVDPVQALRYD